MKRHENLLISLYNRLCMQCRYMNEHIVLTAQVCVFNELYQVKYQYITQSITGTLKIKIIYTTKILKDQNNLKVCLIPFCHRMITTVSTFRSLGVNNNFIDLLKYLFFGTMVQQYFLYRSGGTSWKYLIPPGKNY